MKTWNEEDCMKQIVSEMDENPASCWHNPAVLYVRDTLDADDKISGDAALCVCKATSATRFFYPWGAVACRGCPLPTSMSRARVCMRVRTRALVMCAAKGRATGGEALC